MMLSALRIEANQSYHILNGTKTFRMTCNFTDDLIILVLLTILFKSIN